MWPTHYIPNQPRVEGTPPPRYYLTTPPYPAQVIEEIASNSTAPTAYLAPAAETGEEVTSAGQPVSGDLRDILIRYERWPPEAIESVGAVVSGVLNDILVTYEGPPEALASAGAVVGGALADPLVRYENWPLGFATEDLISAGEPVSGALT
jgi:hypothetical protein